MLDLSQYRVQEDERQPTSIQPQLVENSAPPQEIDSISPSLDQSQPLDVSQYQIKEEPSFMEEATRNVARWGSRMLEQFFGGYGDTSNSIKGMVSGDIESPKSIFGMDIPKIPQDSLPQWDKDASQAIKRLINPQQTSNLDLSQNPNIPSQIQKALSQGVNTSIPNVGSGDLEALSKTASKGYLAPQGEWEEKSDEVFKNLGRLLNGRAMPGPRNPGPPPRFNQVRKFAQDLGTSVAAEVAKEGVKVFGGSDETQEKAKLATLFTAGMMLQNVSGRTADNYVNGLYRQRDELIPKGASFGTAAIEDQLNSFINRRLKYGGPTPEKNTVLGVTEEILSRIQGRGGQMSVDELLEMGRNVNRNSASVYMQPLDKAGVRAARSLYGELNGVLNNVIEGQLGTLSPQALQIHRQAQSGWGALQGSRKFQHAIRGAIKGTPFKTGVASMLGGSLVAPQAASGLAAGAALGAGILSTGEALSRIYLSPTMRHYYSQAVMNSFRENLPAMMHALKKLDEAYYQEVNNPKQSKQQIQRTQ